MPTKAAAERPSEKPNPILSVRLNDEDNPDRAERFERNLGDGGATATNVVKALIDAYNEFVEKHHQLPLFPLEIVSAFKKDGKR